MKFKYLNVFQNTPIAKHKVSSNVIKKKVGNGIWNIVRAIFILGFSFVILFPLLNMLSRAFMTPEDLYDSSVLWIPQNFTLENFKIAVESLKYGTAFFNSLWSSLITTVLQLLSCVTAGYALARYKFPGHKIVFALVILTLIVPPQVPMVSSYMYFNNLKMLDTQLPLILTAATGTGIRAGLFIYMFRQSFAGFPKETEEAAMVDGAGHFRTFFSIMLPGATNVIVTVTLFSFVWYWNDVFFTGLYNTQFWSLSNCIEKVRFYFLDNPLYQGFFEYDPVILQNLKSVAALLIIAPLVLLFLVLQRYFVESVERSGVVG